MNPKRNISPNEASIQPLFVFDAFHERQSETALFNGAALPIQFRSLVAGWPGGKGCSFYADFCLN